MLPPLNVRNAIIFTLAATISGAVGFAIYGTLFRYLK